MSVRVLPVVLNALVALDVLLAVVVVLLPLLVVAVLARLSESTLSNDSYLLELESSKSGSNFGGVSSIF